MKNTSCVLLLIAVSMLCLGGCKQKVKFQTAAPYSSAYVVRDAVIVSFPDDLPARQYKIKVGDLWETKFFIIPVYDAYRGEATGRMKGVFTEGVSLTSRSFVESLLANEGIRSSATDPEFPTFHDEQEGDAPSTGTDKDLETILDEMARQEKGEERKTEKSSGELTKEALELSTIEMFQQRDPGFLLNFQDAQLGMLEDRIVISFRVQFIDWRTKNILFEKRYQGRSQVFRPYRNAKTNEVVLYELTKQAFSGTMSQLMEDMVAAVAAEGPGPR